MSILMIDISRKIAACGFARTLGGQERFEKQLSQLQEHAGHNNMSLVDTILDSNGGSEIDRLTIEALYEGVEKGLYEIILITHSDRIANDVADTEAFCKKIELLGGRVYSLAEGYLSFD